MRKIYLHDFGIEANSTEDVVPAIKEAIKSALNYGEPCEIVFDQGIYNAHLDNLSSLSIHISNTFALGNDREKGECDTIERRTPFLLDGASDITINGCGSLIKSFGKMTQIILKDCENITFKNLTFDYVNPTVTEMTVISIGDGYMDLKISDDYPYKIINEKIVWYGANYEFSTGISQLFDVKSGFTWRYPSPLQDKNARYEELEKGLVRLYYTPDTNGNNPYGAKLGYVFQMREPIRDECGVVISGCRNTTFVNTTMHFMSGIGFIVQNCDGMYLSGFNVYPSVGRTAACSADFMHFSGCRGKIIIENGFYLGAHDDAINVHGIHLKILSVDKEKRIITVRFMHSQTYGIGGFEIGDRLGAINPDTLIEEANTQVSAVCELNPYEIALTVESVEGFEPDMMVENISATAEALIRNNHFERIPTRGILVTTRKPVVIENNVFEKVKGCGVLIADDARSWFESGCVTDVTIRNNVYRDSANRFVIVAPECIESSESAVHKGVKIIGNLIELSATNEVVSIKNTDGVIFENNIMYGQFDDYRLTFINTTNTTVRGNTFNGKKE